MRELTRSMMRLSWTMPVLGLQQMSKMMMPKDMSRPWGPGTEALDALNDAARKHVGETWSATLKAGDQVQDAVVDLMFRMMPGEGMDPTGMMKTSMSWMQKSMKVVGRALSCGECGKSAPESPPAAAGGWGPMPERPS